MYFSFSIIFDSFSFLWFWKSWYSNFLNMNYRCLWIILLITDQGIHMVTLMVLLEIIRSSRYPDSFLITPSLEIGSVCIYYYFVWLCSLGLRYFVMQPVRLHWYFRWEAIPMARNAYSLWMIGMQALSQCMASTLSFKRMSPTFYYSIS